MLIPLEMSWSTQQILLLPLEKQHVKAPLLGTEGTQYVRVNQDYLKEVLDVNFCLCK